MPLVSMEEAVRILGVSDATIRRRLRNGTLQGHKVGRLRGEAWRVEVPDAPSEASPAAGSSSDASPGEAEGLRALVTSLERELDSRRQEAQQLHQEIQQLHVLLRQALDLLHAPRREAMSHEAKKSDRSAPRRDIPAQEERPLPPLEEGDEGQPRWWALGVQLGSPQENRPK